MGQAVASCQPSSTEGARNSVVSVGDYDLQLTGQTWCWGTTIFYRTCRIKMIFSHLLSVCSEGACNCVVSYLPLTGQRQSWGTTIPDRSWMISIYVCLITSCLPTTGGTILCLITSRVPTATGAILYAITTADGTTLCATTSCVHSAVGTTLCAITTADGRAGVLVLSTRTRSTGVLNFLYSYSWVPKS